MKQFILTAMMMMAVMVGCEEGELTSVGCENECNCDTDMPLHKAYWCGHDPCVTDADCNEDHPEYREGMPLCSASYCMPNLAALDFTGLGSGICAVPCEPDEEDPCPAANGVTLTCHRIPEHVKKIDPTLPDHLCGFY